MDIAHATIHRMAALQVLADGTCPKCGYALKGLTSAICPECGIEFTPELVRRAERRARRWRWLRAFLIVAFIMYAPHAWLLFIDYPWSDYHWDWLRMWPILPGLPATILTRLYLSRDLPDWVEFAHMGALAAIVLVACTWIASRNRWALIIVIVLLAPLSIWLGLASHALFRM